MKKNINMLILVALCITGLVLLTGCDMDDGDNGQETAMFTVTINVQPDSPTAIAPVAWAVHTDENPLFTEGTTTRIGGLEALAEDGAPTEAGTSLETGLNVVRSGIANTPSGETSPGPAAPGESYTFTFNASEGEKLSFATMYVESNDLFFAPGNAGIDLFSDGEPISGEITMQINLFDVGTEVNQQPGTGADQAPRQAGANTGASENEPVRLIGDVMDGFTYPAVSEVITVTISSEQ